MNKNQSVAGLVIAGCLLFSGCAKNPADDVPAAGVKTPAVTASADPAAVSTPVEGTVYAFAEGTEVQFVGSKLTGSHPGGFKSVKGNVTVPGDDLEKAVVDLTIDMTSLYSDDEKLTTHLKSDDFFAVDSFKEATFKSQSFSKTETGLEVTGDLNLHGVSKTISFPATITVEGDKLTTQAEFAINRKDFGIEYPGKPDDLIRDEVVVKYSITADKQG